MNARFLRSAAVILSAAFIQAGCKKKHTEAPPTPTPVPTPAAIIVPSKRMDVSKLFSGINIHTSVDIERGLAAETERDDPTSYTLDLQLKVRVPAPSTGVNDLQKLNARLPEALPWLEAGLATAKVSPFYDEFYRLKVNSLYRDLPRLDTLISKQHFFDCETVLELESQTTKRHALLIQAAMEVDTDGSDSDRVAVTDGNSSTFQPMTSYKWPKKTDKENPFLAASEDRLRKLKQELSLRTTTADRSRDLTESLIPDAMYEVAQLKKSSFLIAADDPFIVLPYLLMKSESESYAPKLGDYCVVIFNQTLYPAIIGDVGPDYKIGEASLRICKEIDARSNANNRPMSELKVTYLIFPGSADKPFAAPDLDKWRARCEVLLNEMGGYKGELKVWEDLTKPKPTPTPSPTISPTPSVSPSPASPSPQSSPSASPGAGTPPAGSPQPATSVSPSPSASATPATGG